ncbi:replication/maintenance protein RepL [Streptomyces mauvecolor]|uniref:Replication/maintenance protein RepL n=1 Tax=Streptomyces mauvecolor TaxID=58345 RepID=A0ABV9UY58_9ACTN
MAQRSRGSTKPAQLLPVSPSTETVNGLETARQLLKSFEKIARKGGTFTTDPDIKPYAFYGGKHLSLSQVVQDNLWKFGLSETSRNVLDHLSVHHDDRGLVEMTQRGLAVKFGCSQSKVSRAIGQLSKHNFTWKERRGLYRLHPLYAYRWGSRKQIRLLNELGEETLAEHEIVIPPARNEATR